MFKYTLDASDLGRVVCLPFTGSRLCGRVAGKVHMRLAILGAALLIAAALMLSNRYELAAGVTDGTDGPVAWRIDHWTGQVSRCQSVQLFCQKVAY
jgi:hypothetical protein